jgi:hypothetical protein
MQPNLKDHSDPLRILEKCTVYPIGDFSNEPLNPTQKHPIRPMVEFCFVQLVIEKWGGFWTSQRFVGGREEPHS